MDIVTHAVTGAATGWVFGHPVAGALAAVAPDLVLPLRRVVAPPAAYRCTHALPTAVALLCLLAATGAPWALVAAAAMGWVSHIVLDVPTHGVQWAPTPFYPFSSKPYSTNGEEWEWFSPVWLYGLAISILWVLICLVLRISVIGFQSSRFAL